MKVQMSELLDTLKLKFNLMKEQSDGNVEGFKSLTSEMMKVIETKWQAWENGMVKSVHEQMEHVTSELRGSLLFPDGRVKRMEELVTNTRDDGKTWMDYCRNIRNHFSELEKEKEQRLQGLETNYQYKILAHDLLIKKRAERMDRLEETACKCGDKRKRSQEEYKTPSPNLELITDAIRDNNETDWNKEDSPTPAPEPSKKRENKRPRIETISPESTPEPAPRAKDKKTPHVELFDGNAAKFKEFLSKLETYFRMRPESYPKKDFNGKILYTSMRLTGSAPNWWMANEKKLDTSIPGHWTCWTDFVEELRKSFGNTHALEDARTKLTGAQQLHSQSMAEFIAYCHKLQLEAQLPVDQLWATLWVGVKDKEVREHLIRIREYGRYKGPRLEETCFDDMLSAGKHVGSNKESERRIQQARDGHKKSSTKE